jgi:arylsulfatase A-like enzyme
MNPMTAGTFAESDLVRPWDTLSDDEKRLFSRLAEVYAGFSEYTDAQIGRIIDYLEESGQLDNTLVFYCADNGASAEGSPNGSVNENTFFNAWPDDINHNLTLLDQLGSSNTYNHYPTGWAMAFSTPFRMFKRYSYAGGTADPMVVSWPKAGIRGARRGASPVPPRNRHRAHDARLLRRHDARGRQRRPADPVARVIDALFVRSAGRAHAA